MRQDKKEVDYLNTFNHLLFLNNVEKRTDEIQFASIDVTTNGSRNGRISVICMKISKSGDYVTFYDRGNIRAVHGLETVHLKINGLDFKIPANAELFEKRWRNGLLLDCLDLKVQYSSEKRVIPERFVEKMAMFRDFIENYDSTPMLIDGTLLGWYRECSFITHTTDVDFAMKINEMKEGMIDDLRRSKEFKLYWLLGKISDSLQISVYVDSVKIDLFFFYPEGDKYWTGGLVVGERRKVRWDYPNVDHVCAGDLLGKLFNVPCNAEEVLEKCYGQNWTVPHHSSNYSFQTSGANLRQNGFWSEEEWKDVYRTF